MPALHQKEDRTQHRWILAQVKNTRRFPKVRMHHLEHPKFTRHVVSFGGDGAERSAPEDVFAPVSIHPQQIRKVRMPVRKLFDSDAPLRAFDFSAQKIRKSRQIQFFAGTNRSSISVHSCSPLERIPKN
jgi:hypothetical protein